MIINKSTKKDLLVFAFLAILCFSLGYAWLRTPLFVDESFYLMLSDGVLHGKVPYHDFFDNKPPGYYLALIPVVILAGKEMFLIRISDYLLIVATAFLVYLIGKNSVGWQTGAIAGVLMIVIAFSVKDLNFYNLMSETIASFLLTAAVYVLLCLETGAWQSVSAGFLFGFSVAVRQSSMLGILPLALVALKSGRTNWQEILRFLAGALLVWLPLFLYLALNSVVFQFIEETFLFPLFAAQNKPNGMMDRIAYLFRFVIQILPIFLVFLVGFVSQMRKHPVLSTWAIASFAMAQAGHGYIHCYIYLVPPLALFAAIGLLELYALRKRFEKHVVGGAIIGIVFSLLAIQIVCLYLSLETTYGYYNFSPGPNLESRHEQPFLVASYLNENLRANESLFILSTDHAPYYLSGRFPATRRTDIVFAAEYSETEEVFREKYLEPLIMAKSDMVLIDRDFLFSRAEQPPEYGLYMKKIFDVDRYVRENYEFIGTISRTNFEVYKKPAINASG